MDNVVHGNKKTSERCLVKLQCIAMRIFNTDIYLKVNKHSEIFLDFHPQVMNILKFLRTAT